MPEATEPTRENDVTKNWRHELMAAAIRQGPSFIVLLLILYGLWGFGNHLITVGIPEHLNQIKAGYREIQDSHTKNLERVVGAFEREQERNKQIVHVIELLAEKKTLLEGNHDLLQKIAKEMETVREFPTRRTIDARVPN